MASRRVTRSANRGRSSSRGRSASPGRALSDDDVASAERPSGDGPSDFACLASVLRGVGPWAASMLSGSPTVVKQSKRLPRSFHPLIVVENEIPKCLVIGV